MVMWRARDRADVMKKLGAIGYQFDAVADLRMSGLVYRSAIPVLLRGLETVTDRKDKSEIVRALSVPWAKPAAVRPLIDQFIDAEDDSLRWTVGNALDIVWDDDYFDDLVALTQDCKFGKAREMVVLGMGRSKNPQAVPILIGLLDDWEVAGHAVAALRKLKAPEARPGLERMLDDKRAWVRKEAREALTKLDTQTIQ